MSGFLTLLSFGLKRRAKDFFILSYSIIYPLALIFMLGYIASNFFKGDNSVTSYDYYTFVLIPFFIFQNLIIMVYVAKDENLYKTSYRFIAAPIGNKAIVLSKIISCTIVMWLCTASVTIVTRLLLGVNMGKSLTMILLMFLTEIFMVSSIGIYIGIAFRNFDTIKGVLNVPINLFALLGGVFFPVGALGETFEKVSYISPLTWINKGIISIVYDNNSAILTYSIFVTLGLGIIFCILAVTSFKKEAFL
ncbi:ABC transporter permease [Paraclostridium ghonii]|uniref:Transport permease protein n=1 Tax=Paraclostridium ghonii TaxID=29358 RepID=A0ABU0N044_9FIRM|nr:ABC transporter permease [Paeniclostridium ghonii]MDQ0556532.1 ABC-2 type transport system permease protein [Paeniclostridium ghonii]